MIDEDVSETKAGLARAHAAAPLPWQQSMVAGLLSQRARWPHAMLITGPAGIGKRVLAQSLARSLLCESPAPDGAPCGICASCRYAAAGQHPDLRIVEPIEVDDDGEAKVVEWISVDRVRALTRWAELTSHRGGAKVALIVPAERMNAPAANALLKSLEEPPPNTYFMVVSHLPGRLPATIISRCQRIAAPHPTPAAAREWLAEQDIEDGDFALAQANYAPLRALMLADAEYQAERTTWIRAFAAPRQLSVTGLGARIDAAPRDARKDRLAAVIDWLIGWCADLARVRAGGAPAENAAFDAPLRELACSVAGLALFRYHRSLLGQRTLLAHPLQPRLVAEALLIDYRALFG
ncbi:MAG: DNA polymerase III subunit delta' [Pseudomonadota bacterium]|nr:DNA polymerase III subunit delta' [Pseudomonadota bacterium]